jgi:branched-subunit amino acid aminotransferase/4-amino-4-deoxychorismate lyase
MNSAPLPKCLLDGRPVASDDAVEHLGSRLAMYGEGCFDTLVSDRGAVLYPGEHLQRLHDGITFLGWMVPAPLGNTDAFMDTLGAFLDANGAADELIRIRVQVWSGDRTVGYQPGGDAAATSDPAEVQSAAETPSTRFLITGVRMASADFPPATLVTSRYRRIPDAALPVGVKWTNGINYILAAAEAQRRGAYDALMLTVDGHLSETTVANLFWEESGTVYTPSAECDLLPGITRGILLELIEEAGIPLKSGRFGPSALHRADAVWICNSVRGVCPVRQIDGRGYPVESALLADIAGRYEAYKRRRMRHVPKR